MHITTGGKKDGGKKRIILSQINSDPKIKGKILSPSEAHKKIHALSSCHILRTGIATTFGYVQPK
jgi:hypothetical protein